MARSGMILYLLQINVLTPFQTVQVEFPGKITNATYQCHPMRRCYLSLHNSNTHLSIMMQVLIK